MRPPLIQHAREMRSRAAVERRSWEANTRLQNFPDKNGPNVTPSCNCVLDCGCPGCYIQSLLSANQTKVAPYWGSSFGSGCQSEQQQK